MSSDLTKIPLVFNVYKPVGKSSFFPVHIFKRNMHYDVSKIGHFGTLDPFAEGVLILAVQGAQKLNHYVHERMSKTYEAEGFFGKKTKSGDTETEVLEEKEIEKEFQTMPLEELEDIIGENFLGEYWQSPHAVSAAKFKGKRLYKLALKGELITLEKRKRDIKRFEILEYNYPRIKFQIEVSSGTYIRSFFEDVADLFGGVGCLTKLVRTKIGPLDISNSITDSNWPVRGQTFDLEKYGMQLDKFLVLNELHITDYSARRYVLGQRAPLKKAELIEKENKSSENMYWIFSDGNLLGLGRIDGEKIETIFNFPVAIERYS
jgi:tRNA pseudouridine55 synthase